MEKDLKIVFGRLLGEIYKTQNMISKTESISNSTIYGLINGLEVVIDEELDKSSLITNEFHETLANTLDDINSDAAKKNSFKGYYDIEDILQWRHEERGKSNVVLKYMKANGQFLDLINKMDSDNSPIEMKNFDIRDYDLS